MRVGRTGTSIGPSTPGRAWTIDANRDIVRTVIDLFGAKRCMFASNFPVDRVWASWDKIFGAFDVLTSDLAEDERTKLFAANAERIYRI